MHNLTEDQIRQFWKQGYLLVKGVFSAAEIHRFRELVTRVQLRTSGTAESLILPRSGVINIVGDMLGKRELKEVDYIILDQRLLACVKDLLGDRLAYTGESAMLIGEGTRGWHKDNVDRARPGGEDWQGKYDVVRCGIYLQDHSRHSGGLKVKVGSHEHVSRWHRDGTWGGRLSLGAGLATNVDSEPGDVVIWNLRTTHSGNVVRLRGLPRFPLLPLLESRVPRALRVPEAATRMFVVCTFGAPGRHLDNYIAYQRSRRDSEEHCRWCGYSTELVSLAGARDVDIVRPTPDYGAEFVKRQPGA